MKKYLLLVFGLVLIIDLAIVGCAKPAPTPTPAQPSPTTPAASPTPQPSPSPQPSPTTPTASPPPQEKKVYKWDMPYALYEGTWDWDVLVNWCDWVRRASGGRIDITPHGGGKIMPVSETFDAVSTGALKIDFTYGPYWTGKTPMAIYASGLPPFTLSRWAEYKVLYYYLGLQDLIREAYAKYNIYYLGTIPTNNCVMLSKRPVTTAADFKGLKMRATGMYGEVTAAAGASVVFLPWSEIYGALEKGVIDAVIAGPLSSQCDSGFHEHTKYFLETPLTPVDCWSIHINMDTWKELPDDLKAVLEGSIGYAENIFTASYFGHDAEWRGKLVKDFGFTVTRLSPEEQGKMHKYALQVLDKYAAKDPLFAKATNILKDYMRTLGYIK